jgi:hypothetical protein
MRRERKNTIPLINSKIALQKICTDVKHISFSPVTGDQK